MSASPTPHAGISRHPGHFVIRLLLLWCLLLGAVQIQLLTPRDVFAAAPCMNYSRSSYTARLCITTPANGVTVSGDVPFTATVTQVSGTMPGIDRIKWYFSPASSSSTSSLASDYGSPYTLTLPTYRFADGSYRLEATVEFVSGYTTPISDPARVTLTLANGVSQAPRSDGSWIPKAGGVTNIVAVGDGAGGLPGATAVGNLAQNLGPSQFLYLGDVYNSGTYTEFYNYYSPTLGPLAGVTNPVPGNHESGNGFRGYQDYWQQSSTPYYSYNAGGWHFIALDSTTQFGQTAAGTGQYNWLAQDLQANATTSCTLVFFHHPRFGLTSTAGNSHMQDIWTLLAQRGVDVVLTGHEHNYSRWQPMDSQGNVVNNGMVQYIVGSGGHEAASFGRTDSRVAARISRAEGVLQLSLNANGGTSKFITTDGVTADQASFNCHAGEGSGGPTPTATATATATATPPTLTPTPTPTPGSSMAFPAAADARVREDNPTTNYGTSSTLGVDAGTGANVESYLRFTVSGYTGTPASATLRLFVPLGSSTGSDDAPALYTSSNTSWIESGTGGITWNTRPARSTTALEDNPDDAVAAGTWVEYDVLSAVRGNGTYTFVLVPTSTDGITFSSLQASGTANDPQLILNGGTSSGTPTATATATTTTVPTATATATATIPSGTALTLTPEADARVKSSSPSGNFGSELKIAADQDPSEMSYLRFSGLPGSVTQATLRLWVTESTSNAPQVVRVEDNSWSETGITWANKPATGAASPTDVVNAPSGSWIVYDVTSLIAGNGTVSFALVPQSTNGIDVSAREAPVTQRPQLVITSAGTTSTQSTSSTTARSASLPTATATATVTSTPTSIPTPVPPTATTAPTPTFAPTPTATLVPPTATLVPATATPEPTPAPTMAPTPTPGLPTDPAIPVMLAPVADTTVTDAQPDVPAGWRPELSANQMPQEMSLVRFDVQGLTQPVGRATLRLYVLDGTGNGPLLAGIPNTAWDEGTLTWNTLPEIGTVVANVDAVTTGTWLEYDVTSLVLGNGPVSLALVAESSDSLIVASREQVAIAPQLVIEQVVPSTPTPVPPPTPEPTPVPPPPTLVPPPTPEPTPVPPPPTLVPPPTPEPTSVSIPTEVPTEIPVVEPTVPVEPPAPPVEEPPPAG